MNERIKCIAIIILINLLITKIYSQNNPILSGIDSSNNNSGTFEIMINPVSSLNGMTKKEVADLRIEKVKENSGLNTLIFPEDYEPLKEPRAVIYKQITDKADWVHDAQFFICNPYLLIILSKTEYINALNIRRRVNEIKYTDGLIYELYEGANAGSWFSALYDGGNNGSLRIWMVNAYDAGFFYANVDINKSENIAGDNSPANIMNSIYSNSAFYHVGRYQKNNISPEDRNAWITLINKDEYTKIYIKLWRNKPADKDGKEDLAYVFEIIP